MQFQDIDDGQYRIHAGSLELRMGEGHIAAVVVNRSSNGKNEALEVFRDIDIQSGHRWPTSDQALQRALVLGASAVSAERLRAARYSADYVPAKHVATQSL